jgi:hypothetical protein
MKFCCKLEKKKSYVYYNFIRPKQTAHIIFGWAVHRNDEITRNVKECSLFDNHWCFVSKQFMTLRKIKVFLRNLMHCIYTWFGLATSHFVVFLVLSEWVGEVNRRFFILAEWLAIYCLNFLFGKKCTYIISYLRQKQTIILWMLLL